MGRDLGGEAEAKEMLKELKGKLPMVFIIVQDPGEFTWVKALTSQGWWATFLDSVLNVGEIPVTNVAEMVDRVTRQCDSSKASGKSSGLIKLLTLSGHGNNDHFRIGDDLISTKTLAGFAATLKRLNPYFLTGATVTIDACDTGNDPGLLSSLSEVLGGVTVIGMKGDQSPLPGVEGPKVTCILQACTDDQ